VIRVFGWIVILGRKGLLNQALLALGLEPVKLLYSETAVVIGLVNIFVPFMVLPIMASIERISPSLEQAAQNLGASGEHVARDAKRRPVKLASSGLRSAHAGANGCASIDGYEVA
jgi:ABC-type Fe3+ transport system permease subunit